MSRTIRYVFALFTILLLTPLAVLRAADASKPSGKPLPGWKAGAQGKWEATENWTEKAVPAPLAYVEIAGAAHARSEATFNGSGGDALLSDLSVGAMWPNAALTVAGGSLTVSGQLVVGSRSRGTTLSSIYRQTGGVVYANFAGVGGFNVGSGSDCNCVAEARFEGGRFLCRALLIGSAANCRATVRVIGSATTSIVVLDRFSLGSNTPSTKFEMLNSHAALHFVLDSSGVTPIVFLHPNPKVASAWMEHVKRGELNISLEVLPPAEDIVLVRAFGPCKGAFKGLPDGSAVTAQDSATGRTFQWTLRYDDTRGGAHDIALTDIRELSDGKKIPYAGDGVHHARGVGIDMTAIKAEIQSVYHRVNARLPPLRTSAEGPPAFPGAEGFGAYAKGGRGGKVLFVTNLGDSGPGSLRDACEKHSGPRTVLFKVGGNLALKRQLTITSPFITIAGQTAPGDGICIDGHGVDLVDTHDVILRCLRVRPGAKSQYEPCTGISMHGSCEIIADHCSVSWTNWDGFYASQGSDRYTIQNCIFAEGLASLQSYAGVMGSGRGSVHHNLLAHNLSRNPHFAKLCQCDWRDNVTYDWGGACGYGDFQVISYVNNYLKPGPSTKQKPPQFIDDRSMALARSLYMAGNILEGHPQVTVNNWLGVSWTPEAALDKDFTVSDPAYANYVNVTTQSADEAYKLVLATAGATTPARDSVDARIVQAVTTGTGRIIRSEKEVGAWPDYQSGQAPADSDSDGIPDEWEKAHGLNPNDPADANQPGTDGYTNLEHYLNDIVSSKPSSRTQTHASRGFTR